MIYDRPARGSFHTFLQSLSSLSSWKELIFMSVLERTFCTHIPSCIIRVYMSSRSSARGEHYRRNAFIFSLIAVS